MNNMVGPICGILGNAPFHSKPVLNKQDSSGSLGTEATELSAQSSLDFSNHRSLHLEDDDHNSKTVRFDLDEFDDVREVIHEYPSIEEEDKSELYWTKDEVARPSLDRQSMIRFECLERSRFIACVEKLFDIPTRNRLDSEAAPTIDDMSQEEVIHALVSSDYRGYEQRCCRSISSARKRAIRQILAAHWVRGSEQTAELYSHISRKQAKIAHLIAQGDAKIAAQA